MGVSDMRMDREAGVCGGLEVRHFGGTGRDAEQATNLKREDAMPESDESRYLLFQVGNDGVLAQAEDHQSIMIHGGRPWGTKGKANHGLARRDRRQSTRAVSALVQPWNDTMLDWRALTELPGQELLQTI